MKIELELSEVELNLLNASMRLTEQLLHDCGSTRELMSRIGGTMGHFFRDSGFDEPTIEDIDALVRKIIGGDE